ncbi:MAG TPA: T9SS type A sorting domain-containing protein [Ignavibacteriaceae bacterium]|mgnify:FL=1|nr:T9SS type A sorting domain-containing protein [Ignavibacteriaceae bacterium]
MKTIICAILSTTFWVTAFTQTLPVPPRSSNALSGSAFVNLIWSMPRDQREEQIYSQVISGNIPEFMRQLNTITANANIGGSNYTVKYFNIPEYLAIGSDSDYFLTPMSPIVAQRICNALNCTMPTKKMVDQIYTTAICKLRPQPIPPSGAMTTVPVFAQHNDSVMSIRLPLLPQYPFGSLVGGTKKDVIISNRIYQNLQPNVPKPVVIYGWHQLNGTPIQPVYNGHDETYADYSHGIRLVLDSVLVNDSPMTFAQLLADPALCVLVSDEGTILKPYYTLAGTFTPSPKSLGVLWNSSSSLKIIVQPLSGTTFKAFYGKNGITFTDSTSEFTDNIIVNNLADDSIYYFKLRALSGLGYSDFSEVLAASVSGSAPGVLIVNGFDRSSAGNTYNFVRQHGSAFKNNGYDFSSSTNDAVIEGIVSLNNYFIVDFILGEESTADETFSDAEQELVKSYLKNGGRLFVSGAEIAWDLDNKGSSSDKYFINNYLKSKYINDAPNGQSGVFYQAEPVPNGIFDGIGTISFDNGTHGTFNVRYPDVIAGVNGGIECLKYSNLTNQFAAVCFQGIYPGGSAIGKSICVGIPFETIYPEEKRNIFMEKVISFFNSPVNVSEDFQSVPTSFKLYQNYPNPFNPSTTISYEIPSLVNGDSKAGGFVTLKVYDVLGNEITTLVNEYQKPGYHTVKFNASSLSSGIYFYSLQTGNKTLNNKMILMK